MSTKSDGQVVIEIVGDDSELGKSLNDASKKTERFGQELQRVNELLKLDPKNITLCEQKQKLLTDEIESIKDKIVLLKQAEKEAQAQFEKGEATEEQYRAIQREIIGTEQALEKLTKEQADYQKELDSTGKGVKKFSEESKDMQKQMVAVSASCTAAAFALSAIGAEAVQASMKFDSAFAKTQTIMDQNVVSSKQMRAEILALSKSSAMSVGDVSEAVYQAISGSVATEDATAFVEQANKLAVSGFTSLSNATDVLTTALNAYGLEADTVGGISNVLIQTQNLGKTSVDELASSMGKAISTGSAYGVNLENLSTAYVELTRGGIDTAEATTYISAMLNELGDAGSNVGGILQEKTGKSFGQLMADGWSLGDVLQVLSDTVDGDTEALMGLWSSQEAGKASNAIMTQSVEDFNAVCAQMQKEMAGTTGTTEKAYKTMTSTSEFIDQRFNNSVNNLGIAFGDKLLPAVDGVKSFLTGVVEGLTSAVEKYPAISAVVTGLTVGLGALAVALTVQTIKTKLATSETLKLTAAMMTNPVTLLITGITTLAVGVGVYAAEAANASEETEKLSATSELQRRELENLQAQYEAVCEAQGETSAEAQLLKKELDEQTKAFENCKETQQEYLDARKEILDSAESQEQAYRDTVESLDIELESTTKLIDKLNELTSAEESSAIAKERIATIVDILNERIPELGLNYDSLTGKLNMTPEQVKASVQADIDRKKNEEKRSALYEAMISEGGLEEQRDKDKEAADVLLAVYNRRIAEADLLRNATRHIYEGDGSEYYITADGKEYWYGTYEEAKQKALDNESVAKVAWKAQNTLAEESQKALDENLALQEELAISLSSYKEEAEAASEETGMLAGEMEAITAVTDNLTASMEALATAYNEAYEAAHDSITSQYSLWDTAADVVAMDAEAVMNALKSQEDYWGNYNANINELILREGEVEGLDELIASFGDGSEKSVNMIAMMAGMSNDDLARLVAQFQNTEAAKETTAQSLAEAAVGLDQRTKDVIEQVSEEAERLNLSEEAKAYGRDTISGYIDGIGELLPDVATAFEAIRGTVKSALAFDYYDNGERLNTYASGTWNANAGLALVGEAGPELVYLRGGERILNAQETKEILNAVYPVAPNMTIVGAGAPTIAGRNTVQLRATIAVPVQVDGREFARATAQYMGEEMESEVI